MVILDFDHTAAHAFGTGFLKGLGAPFQLFVVNHIPPVQLDRPTKRAHPTVLEAMGADWDAVGRDLASVIGRHEQQETAARATGNNGEGSKSG